MFRYLNRIGIFKTNQINPIESSNTDPINEPPPATGIDPKRGDRARSEVAHPKQQRVRQREESADDLQEPKRIRFNLSDSHPSKSYSSGRTVKLKSSDGKIFEVDGQALAELSEKVRSAMESAGWCAGEVVGVPEVEGRALAAAIEYCEKRLAGAEEEELKEWAKAFFRADQSSFFDVTLAAYHLKMKSLLDLTSQTVTDMIRGKTPFEVKKILNIQADNLSSNS